MPIRIKPLPTTQEEIQFRHVSCRPTQRESFARLFVIGTPDNFGVLLTIGGLMQTIISSATGFSQGQSDGISRATIDLDLFGRASGATISSIVVYMGNSFGNESPMPTLAAVAALHDSSPVPEPASIALLGLGLAGLAATRRRKP